MKCSLSAVVTAVCILLPLIGCGGYPLMRMEDAPVLGSQHSVNLEGNGEDLASAELDMIGSSLDLADAKEMVMHDDLLKKIQEGLKSASKISYAHYAPSGEAEMESELKNMSTEFEKINVQYDTKIFIFKTNEGTGAAYYSSANGTTIGTVFFIR